ncbi:MAG TPA: aminotransferase class I/II-fold pyridoxal phosphate-dependent enzyme [Gemmatimonadaceae bacterium]|nr:aminotransferase class I/II-fold pyridoxal phosphate-dependent enzyme [Gemmatimonadaceae bacterium]
MSTIERASRAEGRAAYRAIPLYEGGHYGRVEIDLSDNTNQWGTPPAAARALSQLPTSAAARYPAAYAPELARAIADYAGVSPDMVVTGCGSDQILDCAFRALAEPGEAVAYADPSFVIVPSFVRANSLRPVPVPWRVGGTPDAPTLLLDEPALLATGARIIYLCSPNNPTGTVIEPASLERVIADAPGIVVIDEAYVEFAGWSAVSLLPEAPHVIVTRTFSKAFGLAGLRIGYALGAPSLVRELAKARGPYALSAWSEPAATAALAGDLEWMRSRVAEAVDARNRLSGALTERGWRVYPSGANFVLAVPGEGLPAAQAIARALRESGIAVRAFSALPGIGGALRITVAPWPQLERLLHALPARGAAA